MPNKVRWKCNSNEFIQTRTRTHQPSPDKGGGAHVRCHFFFVFAIRGHFPAYRRNKIFNIFPDDLRSATKIK